MYPLAIPVIRDHEQPKNALRPIEGKGCVVVIDGMALIPDVGGILAVESK